MTFKRALTLAGLVTATILLAGNDAQAQCSGGRGGASGGSAGPGYALGQRYDPLAYQRDYALQQQRYLQNQQLYAMRQQTYQQQVAQKYQQRQDLLAARKERAMLKREARDARIAQLKATRQAEREAAASASESYASAETVVAMR
ncbi:hypothetical protein [Rosistilla oblonga]|uniref:hypothetical protein n=1 Tax=Rosistilla oblonga TaxID=2527990 RepID=UPI003A97C586